MTASAARSNRSCLGQRRPSLGGIFPDKVLRPLHLVFLLCKDRHRQHRAARLDCQQLGKQHRYQSH
jgi:hypothetical protein